MALADSHGYCTVLVPSTVGAVLYSTVQAGDFVPIGRLKEKVSIDHTRQNDGRGE